MTTIRSIVMNHGDPEVRQFPRSNDPDSGHEKSILVLVPEYVSMPPSVPPSLLFLEQINSLSCMFHLGVDSTGSLCCDSAFPPLTWESRELKKNAISILSC